MWKMKRLVLPTMGEMGGQEYEVSEQVTFFFFTWEASFSALTNMPSTENANVFSHVNSSNMHTWYFWRNTTFLMYLHCASFNRNECPFLYLNMSKEYFDFKFRILSGFHSGTSYVKTFWSAWPFISVCSVTGVYIIEWHLCKLYETQQNSSKSVVVILQCLYHTKQVLRF